MSEKDLGTAGTGYHDWYWQRISAAFLLLTLPVLMGLILFTYNGNISFETLNLWLTQPISKTLSNLFVLALLVHVWTGLKVIIEDYVHASSGRVMILNMLLIFIIGLGAYLTYHIWAELAFNCLSCNVGKG